MGRAIKGHAGPRNVHGCWISDGNYANGAKLVESPPAFPVSSIVRGQGTWDSGWRCGKVHYQFSPHIQAGKVVVVVLGNSESVAGKHQRRFNFGCRHNPGVEDHILA